jgi:hypothetical protein
VLLVALNNPSIIASMLCGKGPGFRFFGEPLAGSRSRRLIYR